MATKRGVATQKQQRQQTPPKRDVNAATRVATALQLALEGHDWRTIAQRAGYRNPGTAFHTVQRELQRTLQPLADEYRTLEGKRLDALLTVYWPKAMDGDGWSMDRVLRLMERRAKLLGLDMSAEELIGQHPVRREYTVKVA